MKTLKQQNNHRDGGETPSDVLEQISDEQSAETICHLSYLKESLKWISLSFIKRIKIMVSILENLTNKKTSTGASPDKSSLGQSRSGFVSHESSYVIQAEMLLANIGWLMFTISTCLEQVNEPSANIFNDIKKFQEILQNQNLNKTKGKNHAHKKNKKYY